MNLHDFIFSNKLRHRYARHISFWLSVYLYLVLRTYVDFCAHNDLKSRIIVSALKEWTIFELPGIMMVPGIIYSYITGHWLMPKYLLKKKYSDFALGFFICSVMIFFMGWYVDLIFFSEYNTPNLTLLQSFRSEMIFSITDRTLIFFTFFIGIKLLKTWYLQQQEELTLTRENAAAELQLLKVQVHPHFLFNTLNNIYSFTINKSPKAAILVLQFSDMMKYMINECESAVVPLDKELKILQDYMGIEKVRYGERLNMQIYIEGDYNDKLIAPLLMIPFLENSFKHGASNMLEDPWVTLIINIKENILHFKLSNSKPSQALSNGYSGIGLTNVQKRLQIIYPGKHHLKIESTENTYTVSMEIELEQYNTDIVPNNLVRQKISTEKTFAYADF